MAHKSLQEQFAPQSVCYGCGPANKKGLQIKSYVKEDKIICHWQPKPHHHAFPNVLNGGIIGTLLDCHCNWSAAWFLKQTKETDQTPCTVTAEYSIKLHQPTPMDTPLTLMASLEKVTGEKIAHVKGELFANNRLCASCQGIFIAVKSGHPAYWR